MKNKKELFKKLLDEVDIQDLKSLVIETKLEVKDLENKLEEVQPKVEFYDAVTQSDTHVDMSEVAKILNFKNIGRNKLFEFLRDSGILRRNNDPYQQYVDVGYLKIVEQKIMLPYGETIIKTKTVVSQKGLDYIHKLLITAGYEKHE